MIFFKRRSKYPARFRPTDKQIYSAFKTLREVGVSTHSGRGTFLIPLLNILETKEIKYKLTAWPNKGYVIELIKEE